MGYFFIPCTLTGFFPNTLICIINLPLKCLKSTAHSLSQVEWLINTSDELEFQTMQREVHQYIKQLSRQAGGWGRGLEGEAQCIIDFASSQRNPARSNVLLPNLSKNCCQRNPARSNVFLPNVSKNFTEITVLV